MVENTMDALLKAGFAKKMAVQYLNNLERERQSNKSAQFIDPDLLTQTGFMARQRSLFS